MWHRIGNTLINLDNVGTVGKIANGIHSSAYVRIGDRIETIVTGAEEEADAVIAEIEAVVMGEPRPKPKPKRATPVKTEAEELMRQTWEAYRRGYVARYSVEPIRDTKANTAIRALIRAVGKDAPYVAQFYTTHNSQWYVLKCHAPEYMVKDAAALHTQWQNRNQVTSRTAREADRVQSHANGWAALLRDEDGNP